MKANWIDASGRGIKASALRVRLPVMVSDRVNNDLTLPVLASFDANELLVPAQALAELFTVLTRKAKGPAGRARAAVLAWHDACLIADTTSAVLLEAIDLASMHQYLLWDAVMLAAAAQEGCRVLLSEDMQDGFIWRGWRYGPRLGAVLGRLAGRNSGTAPHLPQPATVATQSELGTRPEF